MISVSTNVLEAAKARLRYIFQENDSVYVSFSGGKDSGVLYNLMLLVADEVSYQGKLGVFHLDYEAQYTATTKYVDKVYASLPATVEPYRCCVPFKVTTCTSMLESYWRPWEEDKRDLWVRPLPEQRYTATDFPFFQPEMWDYDFQEKFSVWHHQRTGAQRTCVLVGIRAQESLHRWRTIASDRNVNKYKARSWTTVIADNVVNAYPLYDWKTEDIWGANAKYGWEYNDLYNLFHLAGVSIHDARVASPFLSTAQESLKLYKVIDPQVWGKMVSRVNGVNFTALYGGTKAMGWKNITKPAHFTWEQYANFLLDTLPSETALGFREKLATSIKFWREKGGVLSAEAQADLHRAGIPFEVGNATNYKTDKLPVTMAYADEVDSKDFSLIPTWKRLCVTILKNDHVGKYMGFSQTKRETEKRKSAIEKYRDL